MNPTETVAMMAATIYANTSTKVQPDQQKLAYDRIAAQAWDLYYAVVSAEAEARAQDAQRRKQAPGQGTLRPASTGRADPRP